MNGEYVLKKNIKDSIDAKKKLSLDNNTLAQFSQLVELVLRQYKKGGRLYIAGNGGSAADAQHLAAEFISKLAHDRAPLPAEALTVDTSILTAIGNDYGFEQIFTRQLRAKATKNDIFLAITTSGNSANILSALEFCRNNHIPSVVFCGNDGGQSIFLADICLIAPGYRTSVIQEMHIMLAHTLCECIESNIFDIPIDGPNDET